MGISSFAAAILDSKLPVSRAVTKIAQLEKFNRTNLG